MNGFTRGRSAKNAPPSSWAYHPPFSSVVTGFFLLDHEIFRLQVPATSCVKNPCLRPKEASFLTLSDTRPLKRPQWRFMNFQTSTPKMKTGIEPIDNAHSHVIAWCLKTPVLRCGIYTTGNTEMAPITTE